MGMKVGGKGVCENRVLGKVFGSGPKKYEVTGGWRKLSNEELHNIYSLPDVLRKKKSRWIKLAGHVAGR
jgi:hypothetical protein